MFQEVGPPRHRNINAFALHRKPSSQKSKKPLKWTILFLRYWKGCYNLAGKMGRRKDMGRQSPRSWPSRHHTLLLCVTLSVLQMPKHGLRQPDKWVVGSWETLRKMIKKSGIIDIRGERFLRHLIKERPGQTMSWLRKSRCTFGLHVEANPRAGLGTGRVVPTGCGRECKGKI